MKNKNLLFTLFIGLLLVPLWMWLAWWLTPKKKLTVAIVDKTMADRTMQQHISLDWVLNQQRYTKDGSALYKPVHDYFGFFPGEGDSFRLKGLERFSPDQLQRLAMDADLVYFADTYGVYKSEWYKKKSVTEGSAILYGGMSEQDIGLLKEMKARHKLMIAEFNSIGSPTRDDIRQQFEILFGMHWTGWTARYFSSLDTLKNPDLPHWLIDHYRQQHEGAWPFRQAGIAWVNNSGTIVIAGDSNELTDPLPHIVANAASRSELNLPDSIKYPFWFDIISEGSATDGNTSAADFVISVNNKGAALLRQYGIPVKFPAILRHRGPDYRFYYFCGDFCDNPLSFNTSCFKGIALFSNFFYSDDPEERASFFWNFYRPLMISILDDEYRTISVQP